MRVNVQHGDRETIVVRQLGSDLCSQRRVPPQVEEVLLGVERNRVQVKHLRPDGLDDAADAGHVLLACSGCRIDTIVAHLRPCKSGCHLLHWGLAFPEGLQVSELCQPFPVQFPVLAARECIVRHLAEVSGHHPPWDRLDGLFLHMLHNAVNVQALLCLDKAEEAVHHRRCLVNRENRTKRDTIHLLDGGLHHRDSDLVTADLDRAVDAAAELQDWRVTDQTACVPRLVPLPPPGLPHPRQEAIHKPLRRDIGLPEVAGRKDRSPNVELARHAPRERLPCVRIDDGNHDTRCQLPYRCEDLARLIIRLRCNKSKGHIAALPCTVTVDEPTCREQLPEALHCPHREHLTAGEPRSHRLEAHVQPVCTKL
mmetsp:Transcript_43686/g.109676  ORF Transcript_43686/g.109676 Transcript_43686/m.109676 type:complete len:368 (-) Transcript_43686:1685-2788(-)